MRVALFAGTLRVLPVPMYGAEMATFDLAQALAELGHDVTLIGPKGTTGCRDTINIIECPRNYVGRADAAGRSWYEAEHRWARSLGAAQAADNADVVHDMSCSAALHEAVCAQFNCRVPHLYTTNGISWVAPITARHDVVVISERARSLAARGGHCWDGTRVPHPFRDPPLPSTRIVRYGVDLDFYAPAAPGDYVLYIGRPHEHKGTELIPLVAAACPDLSFVVAWRADAPDHKEAEVAFLAAAQGISNLRFVELPETSHHSVKRDLMAGASVFMHPAVYHDALPVAPLEATACGVPIAAFDRGGVSEIVRDGVTGVLVPLPANWPEGDSKQIAVQRLAGAVRQATKLSRKDVRRNAEKNWSRLRMAQDYVKLYEEVIADGRW